MALLEILCATCTNNSSRPFPLLLCEPKLQTFIILLIEAYLMRPHLLHIEDILLLLILFIACVLPELLNEILAYFHLFDLRAALNCVMRLVLFGLLTRRGLIVASFFAGDAC